MRAQAIYLWSCWPIGKPGSEYGVCRARRLRCGLQVLPVSSGARAVTASSGGTDRCSPTNTAHGKQLCTACLVVRVEARAQVAQHRLSFCSRAVFPILLRKPCRSEAFCGIAPMKTQVAVHGSYQTPQRLATNANGGGIALMEGLNRLFFSRARVHGRDAGIMVVCVAHGRCCVPVGIFPSRLTDSVVCGRRSERKRNHHCSFTLAASVVAERLRLARELQNRNTGGLARSPAWWTVILA